MGKGERGRCEHGTRRDKFCARCEGEQLIDELELLPQEDFETLVTLVKGMVERRDGVPKSRTSISGHNYGVLSAAMRNFDVITAGVVPKPGDMTLEQRYIDAAWNAACALHMLVNKPEEQKG